MADDESEKLHAYSWPELLTRPRRELLVDELLFTTGVTILVAQSGEGKTTLANSLGLTVTTRGMWGGKPYNLNPDGSWKEVVQGPGSDPDLPDQLLVGPPDQSRTNHGPTDQTLIAKIPTQPHRPKSPNKSIKLKVPLRPRKKAWKRPQKFSTRSSGGTRPKATRLPKPLCSGLRTIVC